MGQRCVTQATGDPSFSHPSQRIWSSSPGARPPERAGVRTGRRQALSKDDATTNVGIPVAPAHQTARFPMGMARRALVSFFLLPEPPPVHARRAVQGSLAAPLPTRHLEPPPAGRLWAGLGWGTRTSSNERLAQGQGDKETGVWGSEKLSFSTAVPAASPFLITDPRLASIGRPLRPRRMQLAPVRFQPGCPGLAAVLARCVCLRTTSAAGRGTVL